MSIRLKRLTPRHCGGLPAGGLVHFLLLLGACVVPAHATVAEGQESAAPAVMPEPPQLVPHESQSLHAQHLSRLDERVKTLSKALDLDAGQQAELRKLLGRQLEQVNRVWNDPAVPAAYRVSATRAINNKTADDIRAMLNEAQKKKYNPPRPPHQAPDPSSRSVEDWMSATQSN